MNEPAPLPTPKAPPAFVRKLYPVAEGRYVFDCDDVGTMLEVSRLHRDGHGELRGNLQVKTAIVGAQTVDDQVLEIIDNFNLSRPRSRREAATTIAERARTNSRQVNWRDLIDEFSLRVQQAEQVGEPAVWLGDVPRPIQDQAWYARGFPLLKRHPTILFGDGGTMKSYLALDFAGQLARQGVRVGIFDWELDAADHRERASRLFGMDLPEIVYVRCSRPLVHEAERLAMVRHQFQLDYAIFDSVAFACSGPPEDAEIAGAYFRALRIIGIGSLHVAHISRAGESAEQRPFGSTFWHAGARSTWFVKVAESTAPRPKVHTLALIQRKANMMGRLDPIGLDIEFTPEDTRISAADLSDVEELSSAVPLWSRMRAFIGNEGPRTSEQLAEELGTKANSIEKAARRRATTFQFTKDAAGETRIALLKKWNAKK